MTRRHLAWCAALAVSVALIWWALPNAADPKQGGVVEIIAEASPPTAGAAAPIPVRTGRIAIVATQPQVDLADDQSFRIAREKRDRAWAERSEAAIGNLMRGIAYVGGKRRLHINCAATICEVTGIADPDPATNSYQPVWEALERDTAGDALARYGLERTAAVFDTGRNPDEFKIQYRRVEALPKPWLGRQPRAAGRGGATGLPQPSGRAASAAHRYRTGSTQRWAAARSPSAAAPPAGPWR